MKNQKIQNRVQEHHDYLKSLGYNVIFTALQGSQNYGLDEYTDDYRSDVDTKSICLPSFEDFCNAAAPVSRVEVLDNDEHAEVKDLRIMIEMWKKENISYIELLYSDYIIIEPQYQVFLNQILDHRNEIATADTTQFLKCIAGMAYEKDKALCHPYPSIIKKIEKYGYDGKQLSHCARLLLYITDFSNGRPITDCYKPAEMYKSTLMNYKKQLDENGAEMLVEEARSRSQEYVERVKEIKNNLIEANDYEVNIGVWDFLNKIKIEILSMHFRKILLKEEKNENFEEN